MRDLEAALADHDLITLRVIGDWWELELTGADKITSVKALSERLEQIDFSLELNYLPPEEAGALQALAQAGGKMPVGAFARRFGDVRQMGPGRLEREEPWLTPENPAEALWYRGLLYRGYDNADQSGNLVEYYYVPNEFAGQIPTPSTAPDEVSESNASELAIAEAPSGYESATTAAVDDLTALLTFAQRGELDPARPDALSPYLFDDTRERTSLLLTLAQELGFLRSADGALRPSRAAVNWLKQPREAQLSTLAEAWSASGWNELCRTPSLRCEGSGWENDPLLARNVLLEQVPRDSSWHVVDDLVQTIKEFDADFQRPEGNYDTWYIRDVERDVFLRGFESWDLVEGRLLRFLLTGPMAWLGLIETSEGRYRLTERALNWLSDESPAVDEVRVPIVLRPDAVILVPFNASRHVRFQVARVARPSPLSSDELSEPFRYQLTPSSLERAREDGIQPDRVLAFLQEASGRAIPASVRRAIERWSENGVEGRLQSAIVIRVRDASILDTLQSNTKTKPFIGERLGDLAAVLRTDDWRAFQQATAQLGLLLDFQAYDVNRAHY